MFIDATNAYLTSLLYCLAFVSVNANLTSQNVHLPTPLQVRDNEVLADLPVAVCAKLLLSLPF